MDAVSVKCEPTPEVDGPNVRRGVPADPGTRTFRKRRTRKFGIFLRGAPENW